ncbi:uncharacterized protein CANTADRAFT_249331 [Suhomyces tanzawaensis NRRL Y-17324]|uniref:Uncharacterized protein n=1 Tax=Suhomyces tanzawaensis NRRL Y-17324 TaxID=984487 RepID=A0A1E4SIB4_9ASCO|nr:uncharacterized protein CANTADRAFT_249331 [Suhomyces tanzawaensis NRRL Y-17324]ODV79162.1 hypothetical protein CANTADRAFT_249331 [Suhomyces tanzawaensis NRRL Y-17324]
MVEPQCRSEEIANFTSVLWGRDILCNTGMVIVRKERCVRPPTGVLKSRWAWSSKTIGNLAAVVPFWGMIPGGLHYGILVHTRVHTRYSLNTIGLSGGQPTVGAKEITRPITGFSANDRIEVYAPVSGFIFLAPVDPPISNGTSFPGFERIQQQSPSSAETSHEAYLVQGFNLSDGVKPSGQV